MSLMIDDLQIEITDNSTEAVKGLDALTNSLERLKKTTGNLGKSLEGVNFDKFNTQMRRLSTALQPLQGFKTQAAGVLSALRHFKQTADDLNRFTGFDKFSSQIARLAKSLEPLSNVGSRLGATLNALSQTATISEQLDSVDFESFSSSITTITQSLMPLGDIQSKLGATLSQLSRFGQVTQQLDLVFQDSSVAENIKKLVEALQPLSDINKSQLSSTLNQLNKLPDIAKSLSEMDMGDFAAQIEKAVEAIRPLADEMNKVSNGFKAFPTKIQRIISQSNRLTSSNKKLTASYGSLSVGISKIKLQIVALYFGLRRIARSMSEWVKESNDYVENLNLFRITMREASDEALDFANKAQQAFGIDPSEWIRFQAIFQNMTTGFGIAADKATVMSKNLTQLGYDLATVFNVDYETAMQKLQSALAGQPRPMREWGFDMSEATLKLAAMNHGIKENVETMTQMEKAQIRYLQIFETAKRQGYLQNFAREIHTPANAMRILNEQLRFFKRELGNAIIPLLMKILPYIQAIVKVLTDAARALAAFFGFELPVIDYSGLDAIGGISDDLDGIESGADGATGAAKKLKNILMGFDEINLLPKDTTTGGIGSGGGGGVGGGFEIDPSIYDYDFLGDVQSKVNEIVDAIYAKVKPIVDFIKNNFDHIKDVVIAIGLGLLAWKIATGVLNFFNMLKTLGAGGTVALGISLMITGIALGASGISNIVAGTGDTVDIIKAVIGAALGLGGSLIAFGTGPVGWIIGISAIIAMTVIGVRLGIKKRLDALIQEALTSGDTLITDIAEAFSREMDSIILPLEPVIQGGEKIEQSKKTIGSLTQEIEKSFFVLSSGATDSAEELEKLSRALEDLLDETQILRDEAYDNIFTALSMPFSEAVAQSDLDVEKIVKNLYIVKAEGDEYYAGLRMQLRELDKDYENNRISLDDYVEKSMKTYKKMYASTDIVEEVGDSFRGLESTLKNINWEDPAKRSEALLIIGESAKKTKENAEKYFDELDESFKIALRDCKDPKRREEMAEALYLFTNEQKKDVYGKISGNVQSLFSLMQGDIANKIVEIGKKAEQDWLAMGPLEQIRAGSKGSYVQNVIKQFKSDTVDPLAAALGDQFASFGVSSGEDLKRAIDNILEKGFTTKHKGALSATEFGDDLWKLIQNEINNIERKVKTKPLKLTAKIDIQNPVIKVPTSSGGSKLLGNIRAMAYAEGGFPVEGELFVAREAGPELVGSIGGKTAVANNDQIVSAVSQGVAKAVSSVLGQGDSSGDLILKVNETEFGRISKSSINKYNRQTGQMMVEV